MKHLLFIFTFLLSGCASTETPANQFDPATGRSTYQSPKSLVANLGMSSGLAGGQRVMMQAFAECDGRACHPENVDIAFFNDSSADLNLDYRRIEITFDGRNLMWEDEARLNESPRYIVPRGEFIRVPLSRGDFERLAEADDVHISFGLTGTTKLRMPHNRRAALRDFAASISPAMN